jgi:hypothetical protein
MATPRRIPPVPTEVGADVAAAADAEYDATWQAELKAAEAEPFEGYTLEEAWAALCEKHPWLIG